MFKYFSLLLAMLPLLCAAAPAVQNIEKGLCTDKGAQVYFKDGTSQLFPNTKGYQCRDFQISTDRKYAGWKLIGELTVEQDGVKQAPLPDAALYVSIRNKSYPAIESSRFINNWHFVSSASEIFAETAFEHGPSTYVLFDIERMKVTESCGQTELAQCKKLHLIVKSKD